MCKRRGARDWYNTMEVQPPILPQFLKSLRPTTNMADQHHRSTSLFCQQQPQVHVKACWECSTTHKFAFVDKTLENHLGLPPPNKCQWIMDLLQRCTAGMLTHMFLYSYSMTSNLSRAITSYARHTSIRPVTTYAEYLVFFFFFLSPHVLVVSHTCLKHTPMKFNLPYLVRATVGAPSWVLSATSSADLVQTKGLKTSFINMTDGYVRK